MNAGADPGPGRWTTPPIGTLPAAADPLHVEGDPDPVATRPALPVLDDAARSPDPSVCPFLRRDVDGSLAAPGSEPADDHACVAIGGPRPQSQRQQELVCLRVAHADCPRYLRGALALAPTPRRAAPAVPRATLAALLILVLSAGLSFGFVVQRGGITMPVVGGTPAPTAIAAVVTASPVASQLATVAPTASTPSATHAPTSAPTAAPTLAPTPSPTVAPTPAPTAEPTVTPTPSPTPRPTATPTSTRYKLLTPCPDRKNCYIYTVRSGDNLYSIAHYFGHPLSVIYAWNPQYPARHLRVGDQIRMPPPTR